MIVTVRGVRMSQTDTPLMVLPWARSSGEGTGEAEPPGPAFGGLDAALRATFERALENGDFRANRGEQLLLYPGDDAGPERLLVVGVGSRAELAHERLREAAGRAAGRASELGLSELSLYLSPAWLGDAVTLEGAARALAEGLVLGTWRFQELRSGADDDERPPLDSGILVVPDGSDEGPVGTGARVGSVVAESQNLARELAVRPANIVTPRYLAEEAERLGQEHGFDVTVLDRAALQEEGMTTLLAVAAGSDEEPYLIAMDYRGAEADAAPFVLVGKGVTFDSGGLSLKTAKGMETMKYDMSGAAAVLGAMRALAALELPLNVVGLVPAVENLPSGHALRPGDVIRSHSGKTIEVLNTDAEGRLILADALSYAARYEPRAMVDIATLTGACVVALGHHAIGLLGTDAHVLEGLRAAAERSGERVWQLPLWEDYREQLKSNVADIKNSGGRPAGTITAAIFLREFAGDIPWAHLDIAGTAWADESGPYQPKGPTGVGVRLFTEWLRGELD